MYKDKEKQRAANREAMRRWRGRKAGITQVSQTGITNTESPVEQPNPLHDDKGITEVITPDEMPAQLERNQGGSGKFGTVHTNLEQTVSAYTKVLTEQDIIEATGITLAMIESNGLETFEPELSINECRIIRVMQNGIPKYYKTPASTAQKQEA